MSARKFLLLEKVERAQREKKVTAESGKSVW